MTDIDLEALTPKRHPLPFYEKNHYSFFKRSLFRQRSAEEAKEENIPLEYEQKPFHNLMR